MLGLLKLLKLLFFFIVYYLLEFYYKGDKYLKIMLVLLLFMITDLYFPSKMEMLNSLTKAEY